MNTLSCFRYPKTIFPLGLAALAAAILPVSAATVTWTGGASGTGTTWNTSANWGGTAVGSGNDLVINSRNGTGDMPEQSVNADFTVRSLSFNNTAGEYPSGGLVIASNNTSGTRTLTFGTGGITNISIAANTNVTLSRMTGGAFNIALAAGANNTWDIGANSSLTLGPISGTATQTGPQITGNSTTSLTKTGAGTLFLGNSSTFGGGMNILAGTVAINGSPAQLIANAAGTVAINGGTLRVITATAQSGTARPFAVGSSTGTIEVDPGKTLGIAADSFGNVPSQVGILKKTGSGLLSLEGGSNSVTYTGGTVVEEGTLRIVANQNFGGVGGAGITVKDGGLLEAGNSNEAAPTVIRGNSVFEQNSRLAPGLYAKIGGGITANSTGFVQFNGNVDISGAATSGSPSFLWDLKNLAGSDKVTLASTFTLTIGNGVLGFDDFNFTTTPAFGVGTYILFSTSMAIDGTLAAGGPQPIDDLFGTLQLSLDGKSVELLVSAVPEPSTCLLLGFGGLAGLWAWRRNRRPSN